MSTGLRCPKKRILFKFLQDTGNGTFKNSTDWGFQIKSTDDNTKTPRWAEVVVVGKDVNAVVPGNFILIEPMMWTLGFEHEGSNYWATAEDRLIAVSVERPSGYV